MDKLLEDIFPLEENIPEQFKLAETIDQREYLINGELKTWNGKLSPVLSPVYIKNLNEY